MLRGRQKSLAPTRILPEAPGLPIQPVGAGRAQAKLRRAEIGGIQRRDPRMDEWVELSHAHPTQPPLVSVWAAADSGEHALVCHRNGGHQD